jgi:hypothetical protein
MSGGVVPVQHKTEPPHGWLEPAHVGMPESQHALSALPQVSMQYPPQARCGVHTHE